MYLEEGGGNAGVIVHKGIQKASQPNGNIEKNIKSKKTKIDPYHR